jgi:hypothetical protein
MRSSLLPWHFLRVFAAAFTLGLASHAGAQIPRIPVVPLPPGYYVVVDDGVLVSSEVVIANAYTWDLTSLASYPPQAYELHGTLFDETGGTPVPMGSGVAYLDDSTPGAVQVGIYAVSPPPGMAAYLAILLDGTVAATSYGTSIEYAGPWDVFQAEGHTIQIVGWQYDGSANLIGGTLTIDRAISIPTAAEAVVIENTALIASIDSSTTSTRGARASLGAQARESAQMLETGLGRCQAGQSQDAVGAWAAADNIMAAFQGHLLAARRGNRVSDMDYSNWLSRCAAIRSHILALLEKASR